MGITIVNATYVVGAAAVLAVAAWRLKFELNFDVGTGSELGSRARMPENNGDRRALAERAARARRVHQRWVAWALVAYAACLTFVHPYNTHHLHLLAARDAARMQPVPYGCLGNDAWQSITWKETATNLLFPGAPEENCSAYLRRTTAGTWPNVFDVASGIAVDAASALFAALGTCAAAFVSKLPAVVQVIAALAMPAVASYCATLLAATFPAVAVASRAHRASMRAVAPSRDHVIRAAVYRRRADMGELEANTFDSESDPDADADPGFDLEPDRHSTLGIKSDRDSDVTMYTDADDRTTDRARARARANGRATGTLARLGKWTSVLVHAHAHAHPRAHAYTRSTHAPDSKW